MLRHNIALIVTLVSACVAFAQDDGIPHLDLVRGLRERGYQDLALTYLEKLQTQPAKLSAEVKAALPLELARSRSEVAPTIPAGPERDQLLQKSRTDLETFLRSNPSPGLAHEATQALANTIVEQARGFSVASERAGISGQNPSNIAKEAQANALRRLM